MNTDQPLLSTMGLLHMPVYYKFSSKSIFEPKTLASTETESWSKFAPRIHLQRDMK